MKTFNELRALVEDEIKNMNLPAEPSNFYEPIRYILSLGGKRLRPVFAMMACNVFSDDVTAAVKPAVGMEIFHNFTLLHDDIMDNSKLRRKQPTVNAKWNDNVAILSGDGMMYIASQYVFAAPENVRKQIMDLYHKTAIEVCEGQQFDMDFETSDDVTLDDYIKMITLKTAVLPAACLKIGALIGGASEDKAQKLYDAGISFGIAFQMQDDYLDMYSTPEVLGKPVGGDVNECKKTVFYHKMTELMPSERVGEWKTFYANKNYGFEEKLQIARRYFAEYKVDAAVQNIIEEYYAKAFGILDTIASPDRITPLREFMEKLRVRID
ncbi:MAG: polyprenyl synthetase family protein [Bacteroidales bacterium]|nr:polyprenyl synthetase family protein [Bacteroidales bacterium]